MKLEIAAREKQGSSEIAARKKQGSSACLQRPNTIKLKEQQKGTILKPW